MKGFSSSKELGFHCSAVRIFAHMGCCVVLVKS
jgi:hypothetical protein